MFDGFPHQTIFAPWGNLRDDAPLSETIMEKASKVDSWMCFSLHSFPNPLCFIKSSVYIWTCMHDFKIKVFKAFRSEHRFFSCSAYPLLQMYVWILSFNSPELEIGTNKWAKLKLHCVKHLVKAACMYGFLNFYDFCTITLFYLKFAII